MKCLKFKENYSLSCVFFTIYKFQYLKMQESHHLLDYKRRISLKDTTLIINNLKKKDNLKRNNKYIKMNLKS